MSEIFQGRIYKIYSPQTSDVYVGSTITSLRERFRKHKTHYRMHLANKYCYLYAFKVVQFEDAVIELLHEGVFHTIADLYRLEGEYIGTLPNACNKNIAGGAPPKPPKPPKAKIETESWDTPYICSVCQGRYTKKNKRAHEETKLHRAVI